MFKRILSDAFHQTFNNLDVVFKMCGAWFALQFTLSVIILAFPSSPGETSAPAFFAWLAAIITMVLSWSSIAVAWHRFVLTGEKPNTIHLRFGSLEFWFLLRALLIGLIGLLMFLPVAAIGLTLSTASSGILMPLLATGIAYLFLSQFLMRFNLALPATAIDQPLGIGEAFTLGEGVGLQMVFASIVLILPFTLATEFIEYLLNLAAASLPLILIQIKFALLEILLQIIVTVLGIAVITAGYRTAIEREQDSNA
ncbi:hypothetical protein [Roseibium litorale]|uniref:ABC-2 type transport system permease protein n=1 Tax=Roseibium litorale TaxID=2803841 RepID=A0ABR9CMG1_9HYPH|nr:hypothetical protein [Roseibium litorale]MBD8892055.1 hypothetical protein [Roseibium litorale]